MLEVLICSVLVVGGQAAPVSTETCHRVQTEQTLSAYCSFVSGFAWGADRKVTFCREFDGRMKP